MIKKQKGKLKFRRDKVELGVLHNVLRRF